MATRDEKAAYASTNAEPDLAFLMNDVGLDVDHQHGLVLAGYRSIRRVAALEDSPAGARAAFRALLGIDPNASPENRLGLSVLVDLWSIAKVTSEKEIQAKAEARVHGGAANVLIPMTDQTSMRKAVEKDVGEGDDFNLPEDEIPARAYLTEKMAEVEQNDPQAATLDQIAHLEHAAEVDITVGFDRTGGLRTVKKRHRVEVPACPEEYRKRIRVEMNTWLMIAAKCTGRPWLANLKRGAFDNFVDHVLGKQVNQIDSQGGRKPDWNLVLSYEYEMRRQAFKLVRLGKATLDVALRDVLKDTELRAHKFIEPLYRYGSKAPAVPLPWVTGDRDQPADRPEKRQKARRALHTGPQQGAPRPQQGPPPQKGGKGKGKGKGDMIDITLPLVAKTPDGRDICFLYNKKQCTGSCGRIHCCRVKGCTHAGPACEHPHAQ